MKTLYLSLFSMFLVVQGIGQTVNPSFEAWTTKQNQIYVSGNATIQGINADYEINDPQFTYNEIEDWSSLNQLTGTESVVYPGTTNSLVELVTENADFAEGTKSVQLVSDLIKIKATITVFGFQIDTAVTNVAPGLLISGEFDLDENAFADQILNGTNLSSLNPFTYPGTGQEIDFQPGNVKGSYKYTGVAGDSAMLVSGLIKDRQVIAYVIQRLPNANTWTDFELEYNYLSCEVPDTIITLFSSSNLDADFTNGNFTINSSYTGVDGSTLLVDNLTMDTLDPNIFPPIANADNSTIFTGDSITLDVRLNDVFCSGIAPFPTVIGGGSAGALTVLPTGVIKYVSNGIFSGVDTVVYEVCNALNYCDTANWYITVDAVPLCVPVDDYRSLQGGTSSVFDATANDGGCDITPAIIIIPVNGIAAVESNGDISYSPLVGFIGRDSLTYEVCSPVNTGQCARAKVYYDVVTGIRNIANYTIAISPNPANTYVDVKLDNNITTSIKMFNMLGKEVYQNTFSNNIHIDLKNYVEGVYLMQLENSLGQVTKKVLLRK